MIVKRMREKRRRRDGSRSELSPLNKGLDERREDLTADVGLQKHIPNSKRDYRLVRLFP
jgi:hypothetical protein